MRKTAILLGSVFLAIGCATNPFTGKKTMALTPNSSLFPMSFQQYDDFLKEHKAITGTKDAQRIQEIGQRLSQAAALWLESNGYKDYLDEYRWEYNLVQDDQINAWCMPGGKIVFFTGILPICKTDAGIAAVMGHEIAHALANHGQQRMSAAMLQQGGATAVGLLTQNSSPLAQQVWSTVYGTGTQVGVMLPFSRANESQADEIGLTLMAIAGYNPNEAVEFWSRMSEATGSDSGSSFMSTHPGNEQRIEQLKNLLPQAKQEAAKFGVHYTN